LDWSFGKSCAVAPKVTSLIGKAKPTQSASIAYSPLICYQTLTSLVMMFLALQAPTTTPGFLLLKCPMFPPLFLLRAMPFVTHRRTNHVILAPVLCAGRTVTPRKQRLPCLVQTLFVFCLFHCVFFFFLCFFFVSLLSLCHLCFCVMQRPFRSPPSSAMQSHIILHVFSSNLSPHPCFFSTATISSFSPATISLPSLV